jgi:hypothetical protein
MVAPYVGPSGKQSIRAVKIVLHIDPGRTLRKPNSRRVAWRRPMKLILMRVPAMPFVRTTTASSKLAHDDLGCSQFGR